MSPIFSFIIENFAVISYFYSFTMYLFIHHFSWNPAFKSVRNNHRYLMSFNCFKNKVWILIEFIALDSLTIYATYLTVAQHLMFVGTSRSKTAGRSAKSSLGWVALASSTILISYLKFLHLVALLYWTCFSWMYTS